MPGKLPAVFKNLNSERNGKTAEEVVLRLRDMINNGELSPGDRLPPERDLAKLLGVSRPTLRAGIRSLSTVGILKSKQGAGTFVLNADESSSLDTSTMRSLSAMNGFPKAEIYEAWIALSVTVAELAAETATAEQIAVLAGEIDGLNASLSDREQYAIHEIQFLRSIEAASNNRILTSLTKMVANLLSDTQSKPANPATDLKRSAERLRNIYRAVCERESEAVRRAMHEHLTETKNVQQLSDHASPVEPEQL